MTTNPNDLVSTDGERYANQIIDKKITSVHLGQGLTKLEYFAAMAMQGLLSNSNYLERNNLTEAARDAHDAAKVLIEELNK